MTNPISMKKTIQIQRILTELKDDINALLGFHEDIPHINYGPCAVFAKLFYDLSFRSNFLN